MADSENQIDRLRKDIQQLQDDISALTKDFRSVGEEQSKEAMERARKKGESILQEARTLQGRAGEKLRTDPLTSVLVAFGVGFLVGKMLTKRR